MAQIYIETAGCSHNFADSEQMAGLLKEAKFELVEDIDSADIVIFNTCTVKSPTENAFLRRLEEVKEKYPYKIIIITGCIAQTDQKKFKKYTLVGTKQIHHIVEAVEESLNDNVIKMLETGEMPPLNLPRVRKNSTISIIPVSRGCLGACTFCKTKAARGNLVSYSVEDIKKEVILSVKDDVKEIWLTSQDLGCYGFDINTNLPTLLKELISVSGDFKIRIGMMNPNHLIKIKDELLNIFNHQKIFKFLHLPLQSGNNEILKSMNRKYMVEEYLQLVNEFKEKVYGISLSTDVIVGFPMETDDQFWDTQTVIRKISPDAVNISRYWPRPGTKAAKMKQLQGDEIKRRSRVLTDISYNIIKMQNEKWLGWQGWIIVDEKGKEDNQWKCRNDNYKQIIVEGNFKLGDILKVNIKNTSRFFLQGEVLQ
jgi:threonylcarbamoyladenosine tRNA methylthiotransferase CDKAL1